MKYYNYIDERVENYRKNLTNAEFCKHFIKISNIYTPDNPHIAENRTLDNPFNALLCIYCADGNEYSFHSNIALQIKHSLPFNGILHKHEYIEFFYVIDGSFDQFLLGEPQHFKKGDFVITDQNCEHSDYINSVDASIIFLQIQPSYLDEILNLYSEKDDLQRFLFHALSRQKREQSFLHLIERTPSAELVSKHLMEQFFYETTNNDLGSAEICKGLLIRLLNHLCMNYTPNFNSKSKGSKEKATLYELERYIRLNYATVDSTSLEAAFHYHRNYYNLLLKKYRGKTFKKYLQDIRLTKANELLHNTNLSIKEIAQNVGYENTSHFYHLYKDKYGHGPRNE